MGAGTLIELIARGKQDSYLIGNPQFSYFKSVYRRYTNFAIVPIRQIFTESPDLTPIFFINPFTGANTLY